MKTLKTIFSVCCMALLFFNQSCKDDEENQGDCAYENSPNISSSFTYRVDSSTVSFTNEGRDYCTSAWNFGDGSTSTEKNPIHTYDSVGIYNVSLVVGAGSSSDSFEYAVEITDLHYPKLIFKFHFDPNQERLNALAEPAPMPSGHAGQSPRFNGMSAHYIELSQGIYTQVGSGEVVYKGEETTAGGSNAIKFDKEVVVGDGGVFFTIPLKDVTPGTYEYLRVSLAYQNFDVDMFASIPLTGTLASFVGYNTFINSFKVKDSTVIVNANRLQGYWAFETHGSPVAVPVKSGQAPGTTVVNPLFATSPIPSGSCLATGQFATPFTITGDETEDIVITVSLSTNKSFEWTETDGDNIWEPLDSEFVVDMGLRGLIPIVQ